MQWLQFTLHSSREQSPSLEEALLALGAASVTLEDAQDQRLQITTTQNAVLHQLAGQNVEKPLSGTRQFSKPCFLPTATLICWQGF